MAQAQILMQNVGGNEEEFLFIFLLWEWGVRGEEKIRLVIIIITELVRDISVNLCIERIGDTRSWISSKTLFDWRERLYKSRKQLKV